MKQTKKKLHPMIPCAGALVVLCAAYGLILYSEKQAAGSELGDADQIYMTSLSDITAISWTPSENLAFEKEGDTWYYDGDHEFPLRQSLLTSLSDTLGKLPADRELQTPEELSAYGLDEPSATFEITMEDGSTASLLIGSQVPGTGDESTGYETVTKEYYASLEGQDQVYTIGSYLVDTAQKELYDFLQTESLPYISGSDIFQLTVTKNGKTEKFSKGDEDDDGNITWYSGSSDTPEADGLTALDDSAALNNLAEAVSGLSIQSCENYKASEEDLAAWGLTEPVMEITWTYKKGDTTDTITLAIGSTTEDGASYYTKKDGSKAVNLVSADAVKKCLNAEYPSS